ncbi:Uncharacterised protein [Mycobacteroides abscessus subsp. abscessus]|nr:Uncharacterised protein [Mycobacteroides abscessus subsp. abscessus]
MCILLSYFPALSIGCKFPTLIAHDYTRWNPDITHQ